MHINQYLAAAVGISRRAADKEIAAKAVQLNGRKALPADRVAEGDKVVWKGKIVTIEQKAHTTIALFKPAGYITSRKRDETNDPTVMELLPKELQNLKPVGRLDKDSEGLLLLTDDGDFLYESTHPKFGIAKEYLVELEQNVTDKMIAQWKKGVRLTEGLAKADDVERLARHRLRVVIHQGMTRQIRRMAAKTNNTVIGLRRIRSGSAELGSLKPGQWKTLVATPERALKQAQAKEAKKISPKKKVFAKKKVIQKRTTR